MARGLNVPDGFALACIHCGERPPDDLTMGDFQIHFLVEHGTTDVKCALCWVGQPAACPDVRWQQCTIDAACYRATNPEGEPHDGDCWLPRIRT